MTLKLQQRTPPPAFFVPQQHLHSFAIARTWDGGKAGRRRFLRWRASGRKRRVGGTRSALIMAAPPFLQAYSTGPAFVCRASLSTGGRADNAQYFYLLEALSSSSSLSLKHAWTSFSFLPTASSLRTTYTTLLARCAAFCKLRHYFPAFSVHISPSYFCFP